ncbi:MAG: LysE family translocator, partial [Elainella sp.]
MPLLLRSILIGFSIAAPVGPIAILGIRRTLAEGWWVGLLTGLGAATADAIYGCIAGFGLTWIASFLTSQAIWLKLIGGLFLCYLGIKTALSKPAEQTAAPPGLSKSGLAAYLSTVFLTLTNPMTILAFAAVFAGLGLATDQHDYGSALVLVAGVFIGSALWWVSLVTGVSLLRSRFNPRRMQGLNRISGAILLVFGIIALSSVRG